MATITARRAFSEVHRHAEKIRHDEHQTAGEMSVGDAWAQGDVALVKLDHVPPGARRVANPEAQLAPGTTQGSRHCLESLAGITIYTLSDPTPLDGPVLDCPAGCRVNHPEHGDVSFGPGIYAVVYQRQLAADLRRVAD